MNKAAVRNLFKEVFKVEQDENFISHESATPKEVDDFIEGEGPGPDPNNLHFDMNGPFNNAWNMTIIQHLATLYNAYRDKGTTLPVRPAPYVTAMLLEKFRRCRIQWNLGRP